MSPAVDRALCVHAWGEFTKTTAILPTLPRTKDRQGPEKSLQGYAQGMSFKKCG